jgi:hypothetical protein
VTVTSGFAAVLLPTPDCPPLVVLQGDPPVFKRGAEETIVLNAFCPWRTSFQPHVKAEIAGLGVKPTEMGLPGALRLKVPADALRGMYRLKVAGDCLPLKRWIQVK